MKTAKGAVKCGIFSVVLSQFYLPKTIFRIPNNEHLGIGETRGDIFPVALELQLHCWQGVPYSSQDPCLVMTSNQAKLQAES